MPKLLKLITNSADGSVEGLRRVLDNKTLPLLQERPEFTTERFFFFRKRLTNKGGGGAFFTGGFETVGSQGSGFPVGLWFHHGSR